MESWLVNQYVLFDRPDGLHNRLVASLLQVRPEDRLQSVNLHAVQICRVLKCLGHNLAASFRIPGELRFDHNWPTVPLDCEYIGLPIP